MIAKRRGDDEQLPLLDVYKDGRNGEKRAVIAVFGDGDGDADADADDIALNMRNYSFKSTISNWLATDRS